MLCFDSMGLPQLKSEHLKFQGKHYCDFTIDYVRVAKKGLFSGVDVNIKHVT